MSVFTPMTTHLNFLGEIIFWTTDSLEDGTSDKNFLGGA